MKEYSYISFTASPTVVRRFNHAIRHFYNVHFPVYEKRNFGKATVVWQVGYYNNSIIGRSEIILASIAQNVLIEHLRHTSAHDVSATWDVWSI